MIIKIIKSILLTTLLICNFTYSNSIQKNNIINKDVHRELILIVDYHKAETIYHTLTNKNKDGIPQGCGAITLGALAAFDQEVSPIALSKVVWDNIYNHAQVYKDFCNLGLKNLANKYKKFTRLNSINLIKQFKQVCIYFNNIYPHVDQEIKKLLSNNNSNSKQQIQEIFLKITNDKRFGYNNAPSGLKNYHVNSDNRDIYTDVILFFICDYIVNKVKSWNIKSINKDMCLFIPNKYLNNLNISNKDIKSSDVNKMTDITETELKLGLKVNHLKDIDYSCDTTLNSIAAPGIEFDRSIKFIPVLNELFVSKQEYNKKDKIAPKWILYLDGHGLNSYSIKKELRKFKKIQNYYNRIINKKFRCCHKAELNNTIGTHLSQCYLSYEYQRIKPIANQINNAILTIENDLKDHKNPLEGTILSLPVSEFKNILLFFNDNIDTEFIYYSSCFAGGEHLVVPFLDDNNKPIKLNYYVTVGTLSENISQLEVPLIPLPPYRDYQMNCYSLEPEESIDIENKKLKFYTALDFNNFFGLIKKDEHKDKLGISKVIASVNPYTDKNGQLKKSCLGNLPSVRHPNKDNFIFIAGNQKLKLIENTKLNTNIIINNNFDVILLNDKNIKSNIIVKKVNQGVIPPIVSIIPGEIAHDIEKIDARDFTLVEVINAFSQLPNFAASKLFKIKTLIVKTCSELSQISGQNKTTILNDFIISHKVHDTNNIKKMKECLSISMPTSNELITGISCGIKNALYSIKWAGTQIRNLFIKPSSKSKQNILLAYHQELTEQPILG